MAAKKGGLGRGLDALFADNSIEEIASTSAVKLKIMDIEPNRDQPRKIFDEDALAELADSIAKHGVIQPLLVRPMPDGSYQLVAGERRWRASRMAGLTEVPVVIKELSDDEAMALALIENLQREDLNAIEEAQGIKALMDTLSLTQDEAAERVGKSRPAVANALRLLKLPDSVIALVSDCLYTHLRAHETKANLVCRLLLEKKKTHNSHNQHRTKTITKRTIDTEATNQLHSEHHLD